MGARAIALAALAGLAGAGLVAVAGPTMAADQPRVSIKSQRSIYTATENATLRVVVRDGGNATVAVFARFAGKKGRRSLNCGGISVNDDTFVCQLYMVLNTTVIVETEREGDGGPQVAAKRFFRVRPSMATQPLPPYRKSGGKVVFARGSAPSFRSAVYPRRRSMCLRHEVQRKKSQGWRRVKLSGCEAINSKGRVDWRWAGRHPAGPRFRVRAKFAGDQRNARGAGTWSYFRFD